MRALVIAGQLPVSWDVGGNRDRVASFLQRETEPGALVVLPEAMLTGYDDALSGLGRLDPAQVRAAADSLSGVVSEAGVQLLVGSLWPVGGGWVNAALLLTAAGRRWIYPKVNLATHERGGRGSALPLFEVPGPDGVIPAGVQLCRELLYPEQWHVLARAGARLLAYLTFAANPLIPAGVWRSHLISRAAETQRFVVAANTAHPDQHCPSMIISPAGEVIAESGGPEPAVLRAELDLSLVSDWRISQQRSDVVAITYPAVGAPGAG